MITVRAARAADADDLRTIERAAGRRFREVGMPEVAEDEPMTVDALGAYADAGRSWVATEDDGAPIGYVVVDLVDGNAHIEQVSVHPDHQGKGVGRALLRHVERWAREARLPALTLTTFTDIPWNAPLYRHLGFRDLPEGEIGPELAALRDAEAAHGLDPAQRTCMRRPVAP